MTPLHCDEGRVIWLGRKTAGGPPGPSRIANAQALAEYQDLCPGKGRARTPGSSNQARTNLSDFIRRKAVEAAEQEVLDRCLVTIPAEDWEKFENWVQVAPKEIPALRKLASSRPAWQD